MQESTLPFAINEVPKQPPKIQRTLRESKVEIPKEKIIRKPAGESKTPLIYRGGKSSIASWVVSYFPPHNRFVDVFGGGAAISLAKACSPVDVYNDIGDVSRFFQVLREYGDEVFNYLTFYPFGRQAFKYAYNQRDIMYRTVEHSWDLAEYEQVNKFYKVRWAAYYYVTILQSFRHEETDDSWIVSKDVNLATSFASHVDDFPEIIDRLRRTIIEHMDCLDLISKYDGEETLLYCDPPYLPGTWESGKGSYKNEMTIEQHVQLLELLNTVKAQVVVSGYPSELYDKYLREQSGWKRVTKTKPGGIHNSSQVNTDRTEVLWIKRKHDELWNQQENWA